MSETTTQSEDELLQGLNDREQRFVLSYLIRLNATQAALDAGYSEDRKSASVKGCRLRKEPRIAEAITALLARRRERMKLDQDRVLAEVCRAAFFDIADLFDEQGKLLPVARIPEDARRAIASVKVKSHFEGNGEDAVEVFTTEIKLVDKLKALELGGKHIGMWPAKLPEGAEDAVKTFAQLVIESLKPGGEQ